MRPDVCQWLFPDEDWADLCAEEAVVGLRRPASIGGTVVVLLCATHRAEVNRPYDEVLSEREPSGCQWELGRTAATKRLCNKPHVKEVKVPLGMGQSGVVELCRVHNAEMNDRNMKRRIQRKAG